jgi:hypothetical protein
LSSGARRWSEPHLYGRQRTCAHRIRDLPDLLRTRVRFDKVYAHWIYLVEIAA